MNFKISTEAVQKYLHRRQEDLGKLKTALEEKNFSSIREVAHQIKGNAATFGFEELGDRAQILESNALSKKEELLRDDIQWIEKWLKEKLPAGS